MSVHPCVCPSVPQLCHLLSVPTHYSADVPYDWQQPAATTVWLTATG